MQKLTEAQAAKFDEPLLELFYRDEERLESNSTVPVILRGATDVVARAVLERGGKVRRTIPLLNAVAAWLPIGTIPAFAAMDEVAGLELERNFSIA